MCVCVSRMAWGEAGRRGAWEGGCGLKGPQDSMRRQKVLSSEGLRATESRMGKQHNPRYVLGRYRGASVPGAPGLAQDSHWRSRQLQRQRGKGPLSDKPR